MIPATAICLACAIAGCEIKVPQSVLDLRTYMTRLSEIAINEGPIPLTSSGSSDFARSISMSQDLAEMGKYAEAAHRLEELLRGELESDWKAMLQTRVEILTKWAKSDRIDVKDYSRFYLETGPEWFHQRTLPIVKLWEMQEIPIVEKCLVIRLLLKKRGDAEGQAIVLEAIADLSEVSEPVAADALLRAGGLRNQLNDLARAEKDWSRVIESHAQSPVWGWAVLSLGRLHKAKGSGTKAMELFHLLLQPRPNGPPPEHRGWSNAQHEAALEVSEQYEAVRKYDQALEYAEKARTEFPFVSHCGTCNEDERQRLARRIVVLKVGEFVAADWWLVAILIIVAVGWWYRRRQWLARKVSS